MLGTGKPLRELVEEIRAMRLEQGAELRETRREHRAHIAEYRRLTEDNRQFTRECITRMQLATARQEKALNDLIDESRAQRRALLVMIDRLGPAPGAAGA